MQIEEEKDLNSIDVDDAVAAMDGTGQQSDEEVEETGQEEETESTEEEESVDALKERLAKAEKDRDNYRKGMLSAQAKDRTLPMDVEKQKKNDPEDDEIDARVTRALAKREQRAALTSVLDSTSPAYIPELSDKEQYKEIIGYMPQNYDRANAESVKRALKVATAAWKFDRGIETKKNPRSAITDTGMSAGDSNVSTKKGEPKLNIPKNVPMSEWFK